MALTNEEAWGSRGASAEPLTGTPGVSSFHAVGLGTVGLATLLVSAWAGIVPFIGSTFGLSADGTGSWYWSLDHAVLGLIPGAVGFVAGLMLIGAAPRTRLGLGRGGLSLAGLLAAVAGAWLVIGPLAWPVLDARTYFLPAAPLTELTRQIGWTLGPGVVLVLFGGLALGWAARHQGLTSWLAGVPGEAVPGAHSHARRMRLVRPVAAGPAPEAGTAVPAGGPASEPVVGAPGTPGMSGAPETGGDTVMPSEPSASAAGPAERAGLGDAGSPATGERGYEPPEMNR